MRELLKEYVTTAAGIAEDNLAADTEAVHPLCRVAWQDWNGNWSSKQMGNLLPAIYYKQFEEGAPFFACTYDEASKTFTRTDAPFIFADNEVGAPNLEHGDKSGLVAGDGDEGKKPVTEPAIEPVAPSVRIIEMGKLSPGHHLKEVSDPFMAGIRAFAFDTNDEADGAIAFGPHDRNARKIVSISRTAGYMQDLVISNGDDNSTRSYVVGKAAPTPDVLVLTPNARYYANVQYSNPEKPDDVNAEPASTFLEIGA